MVEGKTGKAALHVMIEWKQFRRGSIATSAMILSTATLFQPFWLDFFAQVASDHDS